MSTTTGANGQNIPSGEFVMLGKSISQTWAGEIDISVSQYSGETVSPAVTAPAFCIELTQDINLGQKYTDYLAAPVAQADQGSLTQQAVQDLTTLYNLYYQGNSKSNWSVKTATAFQLDCWKITSNPGNYTITGSSAGSTFYDKGWNTTAGTQAVDLAQQWLTAVQGSDVNSNGSLKPVALTSATNQDILFTQGIQAGLIPFKVNPWPGAAALGAVVFLRMRRRMGHTA